MANDTFIPEMQNQSTDLSSMYSRSSGAKRVPANGGTFIPGMHQQPQPEQPIQSQPVMANTPTRISGESVVGFLYSISRQGLGEYWPLHLGSNSIGRSDNCEIQLKEITVSDRHATISVKKMKTTGELVAMIRDEGSKNGMFLNEEELDYNNHPCKNGDVITVGLHYKFLLILINAEIYGLKVDEEFQAVQEEPEVEVAPTPATPQEDSLYGRRGPRTDDGTVDLGGASPFMGGGTQVL